MIEKMFSEYVSAMYPDLSPDSRQYKALKHSFFIGAKALASMQTEVLSAPTERTGFDPRAMAAILRSAQDEINEFMHGSKPKPPESLLVVPEARLQ